MLCFYIKKGLFTFLDSYTHLSHALAPVFPNRKKEPAGSICYASQNFHFWWNFCGRKNITLGGVGREERPPRTKKICSAFQGCCCFAINHDLLRAVFPLRKNVQTFLHDHSSFGRGEEADFEKRYTKAKNKAARRPVIHRGAAKSVSSPVQHWGARALIWAARSQVRAAPIHEDFFFPPFFSCSLRCCKSSCARASAPCTRSSIVVQ